MNSLDVTHPALGLLLASLAAAAAFGQQQVQPNEATTPASSRRLLGQHWQGDLVPIHTAAPDAGVAYGVWAAGTGYKASFHDGATLVPVLGESYPHNLPLTWRTQSVRLGDRELVTQAPRLTYAGLHAEYDLGGLTETYEVGDHGIEQQFVLSQRPAVIGDLVVRGSVETVLHAAVAEAAHQALDFCDEQGKQLIRYGAATAVDARGERQPMTTSFADGQVTLRLDASWLAQATFPVVVDPLLGPGQSVSGTPRAEIDVVNENETVPGSNAVWIAYTVVVSASDHDLYVKRWNDDGTYGTSAYQDVTTSWSTFDPHCTYSPDSHQAVISFDRFFLSTLRRYVRYHQHARADLTSNTSFVAVAATDNAWRSDVSANILIGSSPGALLVWQQEPNNNGPFQATPISAIYGCYLDLVNGTAGVPFPIASSLVVDYERPNLPVSGYIRWVVAYQAFDPVATNRWSVALRQVSSTTGVAPTALLIDNASPDHKMAPILEGLMPNLMVAFTSSTLAQQPGKPTGINGHQIRTVTVDWDYPNATGVPSPTVVLQSNIDPRLEIAGVGFDTVTESHWNLAFRSTVSDTLYMRTVGFTGNQLHAETLVSPVGTDTSVRGGVGFDASGHQFILAYGVNSATAGNSYVTLDRFVFPSVTPWSATGSHCSAADIAWYGSQLIGDGDVRVNVTNAPSNSLHILVMATQPTAILVGGVPPFHSGCWVLVPTSGPDYVGIVGLGLGHGPVWNLALPEFLTSYTYYFQDFHTDGGPNFELWSTQRLEVPTVR